MFCSQGSFDNNSNLLSKYNTSRLFIMIVNLCLQNIENIKADALVMPVDGNVFLLGSAAMKALKESMRNFHGLDDWREMLEDLEREVRLLCPIPQGQARIIPGDADWEWLLIIACQPHHVNDQIVTQDAFCKMLSASLSDGFNKCSQRGIKSIALTLISTGTRISPEQSIFSIAEAFATKREIGIEIYWSFINKHQLQLAQKTLGYLNIPLKIIVEELQ